MHTTPHETDCRVATELLMERFGNDVMRICLLSLWDWHLAQDACQETFFRAWKHMDAFRRESSERTWLFRIAVNVCRDMKKARWHREKAGEIPMDERLLPAREIGTDPGPITRIVMDLPEKYRLPLLLHYYHGFKVTDIASVLGVPYPTALTRLKRGRDAVRRELEKGGVNVWAD